MVTYNFDLLRDDILLATAPPAPTHYIPNPDPNPLGTSGYGAVLAFLEPSDYSFRVLLGTVQTTVTASVYEAGQVALLTGAEGADDHRIPGPGQPTGIVRPVEPEASTAR